MSPRTRRAPATKRKAAAQAGEEDSRRAPPRTAEALPALPSPSQSPSAADQDSGKERDSAMLEIDVPETPPRGETRARDATPVLSSPIAAPTLPLACAASRPTTSGEPRHAAVEHPRESALFRNPLPGRGEWNLERLAHEADLEMLLNVLKVCPFVDFQGKRHKYQRLLAKAMIKDFQGGGEKKVCG